MWNDAAVIDGEEVTPEKLLKFVSEELDVPTVLKSRTSEALAEVSMMSLVFRVVDAMRLRGWQFHADDACPELEQKASVRFVRWPKPAGEPVTGVWESALDQSSVFMAAFRALRNWRKKYPE